MTTSVRLKKADASPVAWQAALALADGQWWRLVVRSHWIVTVRNPKGTP